MFRLILLDRDGVINEDSPDYIKSAAEWRPIPGALQAIAQLRNTGRQVGVCTNQAGIGRGIFSQDALIAIHQAMHQALKAQQSELSAVVFCPHHPDDGCDCRKPAPGMLLRLMQVLQISPSQTCFVGDSMSDLQAAQQASVQPILVRTGNGQHTETQLVNGQVPALTAQAPITPMSNRAPLIFDDLQSVARALIDNTIMESV